MKPAKFALGYGKESDSNAAKSARLMGWASFGLAAAMLAFPERIARTFGLEGKENLIRTFGVQELLAGAGVLGVDETKAMWGRAGGDVIHIGTLATGLGSGDRDQQRNVIVGLAALAGFLVADALIAARLQSERGRDRERDYEPAEQPQLATVS